MWELSTPWYELVIKAVLIYSFFFFVFRFFVKKNTVELTRIDLLFMMILTQIVDQPTMNGTQGHLALIISTLTFLVLIISTNWLVYKYSNIEILLYGEPSVLIHNGELCHNMIKHHKITERQLEQALRMNGVLVPEQIQYAILEINGKITVIRKE